MFTVGTCLLVYGLNDAENRGWKSAPVITTIVLGALTLIGFPSVEARLQAPFIPRTILFNRHAMVPACSFMFTGGGWITWLFLATQICLNSLKYSTILAACYFLPAAFASVIGGGIANTLVNMKQTSLLIVGGYTLSVGALIPWGVIGPQYGIWYVIVFSALYLFSSPIVTVGAQALVLQEVPVEDHGRAAALTYVLYQFGSSLFLAVANILIGSTSKGETPQGLLVGYRNAIWSLVGFTSVGLASFVVLYLPGQSKKVVEAQAAGTLMERLNTVLKHINLLDNGSSQQGAGQPSAMQILQFQVSIPESEMVASKLATSLYLEALLMTGATIDDAATVNYMCSRHQNDYQSAFMDLVAASFHILKTQQSKSIYYQQCQLFVQNKLPILLSMISGSSFNSFNTEQAIIDGWAYQDLGAVASRFLHTCSLHHLLTAQAVSQLLGSEENNTTKLYAKDDLVSQVRASHTRGPKLVDELVRSDGSAGSISQALVEIMHSYCQSKETQYLKDLVNAILRKPAAINCICLFIRPAFWLGPLCTLLDEWRWDEIHGEAQPVYDEFGAVFLLVLVTKTRLRLSNANVGVRKKDGFLARYFDRENLEESLEKLPEATTSHLGNWVNALYLAEGLSDELFTSCSPHDFYLLIPTLLRQSIVAYQQGKLTQESLKAGLDYLLEPFLLPSLIPALDWVGNLVKEDQMSAEIVLQALLKSPSGSESRDIHQTILGVCAPELEMNIRASQSDKFGFALKVVEQLPESSFSVAKLQDGPVDEVQPHIVALIMQQSSTVGIPAMVRRLIEIQGAELALKSLLGVLLQLSGSPDFLLCLDVIATLVSVVHNGLREALRLQSGTLGTLLKKGDTLSAEAVVRLHRLVEAYTNFLTPHDMGLDSFDFTNIDTTNPNLDENAPTSGDVEKEPSQADGIDQVLDEVAAMGNMDSNDADMNFDALYGLQGGDMDLNDLDLDMF
ncbi:Mediator of RNA polymerase II transcription subunit 5 [Exophiala dermatitidis]